MKYKVTHSTVYQYSKPVSVCHNRVMLTPRGDARSRCESHRIRVLPTPPSVSRRDDYFGNQVHCFTIEESHRQLTVTASSRVVVEPFSVAADQTSPAWEVVRDNVRAGSDPGWFEACQFTFDSPRVERAGPFADYAAVSFTAGRPVLEAALDLTARMHAEFTYNPKATTVTTPTAEAFQQRHGVCQDFAHVEIACLRSLGIPARYVSGYLRTIPPPGEARKIGADQSHAWISVYCGSDLGWIDLDPTNNCICSTDHVPVAWARDYSDVTPMKGVFLGGGEHTLSVSVDVQPVT